MRLNRKATHSLFWRILAAFWLALLLVVGLSILLGRALNQDTWIITHHPGLKGLAEQWTALYEEQGSYAIQGLLEQRRHDYGIFIQVLDESGQHLVDSIYLPRPRHRPPRTSDRNLPHSPWRQLGQEYVNPQGNHAYLLIYRIPHPELEVWYRGSLLWPLSALGIALMVLTLFSLLLTLSIIRPLNHLRCAVHDLSQTAYQKDSLVRLARRGNELGTLARDFSRTDERLQSLVGSQRQLLRGVSHELRSLLTRLCIALALAERAEPQVRAQVWPCLEQECGRLEALIDKILVLARLDIEPGASQRIALLPLLQRLRKDTLLLAPEQDIRLEVAPDLSIDDWPDMSERAIDNLLRNAVRFNPAGQPLKVRASSAGNYLCLNVHDHGPGIAVGLQEQSGEPLFHASNQNGPGHGLDLAIAHRAIERHDGHLRLGNHPDGGFIATLSLSLRCKTTEWHHAPIRDTSPRSIRYDSSRFVVPR